MGAILEMLSVDKKYEEFAYVLDFLPRGKSVVIKGREGAIVQAVGEERLTLLEFLAMENQNFETGEKVKIGKEGREKIISVLGKADFEELSAESKNSLPQVVETLVKSNEQKLWRTSTNSSRLRRGSRSGTNSQGIGKTFMMEIVNGREKRPFISFDDLQQRVGLREPAKLLAKRIVEELEGGSRINLFVKK